MKNTKRKSLSMKCFGFVKDLAGNFSKYPKIYKLKLRNLLMRKLRENLWENDILYKCFIYVFLIIAYYF